jgi:hypothetical protein
MKISRALERGANHVRIESLTTFGDLDHLYNQCVILTNGLLTRDTLVRKVLSKSLDGSFKCT